MRNGRCARWGLCFALALCFHAAGAAALLAHWSDDADLVANAPVITIELAPVPVAPQTQPTELPPGPQQTEAKSEPEPQPQKPVEKDRDQADAGERRRAHACAAAETAGKADEKSRSSKQASLTSAPSTAEQQSRARGRAGAGRASHNPYALPNWKSALVAQLERYKRYPSEAQARGEHGVAQLAFSVDRSGGVHNARIVRSSGSSAARRGDPGDLVARAQPLPPPPPEIHGAQIAIVVPIRYNVR